MIWAIFSDIHGRGDRLARILADAQAHGATCYLCLGDVGSTAVLDVLVQIGATCVFGNWEASGLRGMSKPYRNRVARWPAQFRANGLRAAHASPIWPEGLAIGGVVDYLREKSLHWLALFPSLQRSEEARWDAFAELGETKAAVFFHGHTHAQEAWLWQADGAVARLPGPHFVMEADGSRYLIGVGSAGDPHDGGGACYTLYDDQECRVEWRRV